MLALMVVCSAVLAVEPRPGVPDSYDEARARAGRSPDDQVRLALWCEARGLGAERLKHLALAVLADPSHATARGLMGLVADGGRWRRPEDMADRLRDDPLLAEYRARRVAAPDTADGHFALATWATSKGLLDEARAHDLAAIRLDPNRPDARKRLGYRLREGRWATDARRSAERAEAEAREQADRRWRPALEGERRRLASPATRAAAKARLSAISDPRAVPSIVRAFAATVDQPRAVQLLGQVDAPEASRALAILAVAAGSSEARRSATETLRSRDPREYAELLIALLRDPVRFEVKHVDGPGSPGELLVEGRRVNVRRVYTPPPVLRPDDVLGLDASGLPAVLRAVEPTSGYLFAGTAPRDDPSPHVPRREISGMTPDEVRRALPIVAGELEARPARATTNFTIHFGDRAAIPLGLVAAEARKSAAAVEAQLRDDVRLLDGHNAEVRIGNGRVAAVLNAATGQALPDDRRSWAGWLVDRVGYASTSNDWTSRPAAAEEVSIAYRPPGLPDGASRQIVGYERRSCFGAGTPVLTATGPRPIEDLDVGDRVLAQDVATGALDYRPVLVVHRNPPSPTYLIKLRGGPIVASPFHRFWVAGRGWAMARELKAGDPIRVLGGVAPIESVGPGEVQPVYNLDVADAADFFAGQAAALVHDNTLPDPRLVPFDREAPAARPVRTTGPG